MIDPLVSIIVPSYNHAPFIENALRSVFDQNYPNIEIIIVDDCSSDQTYSLCKSFFTSSSARSRFSSVQLCRNMYNEGAHATLNKGIKLSNGSFLAFLNSDDYYGPDRISVCMRAVSKLSAEFIFTGVKSVDSLGKILVRDEVVDPIADILLSYKNSLPSLSFGFLGHQLTVSTGNMIVSRRLISNVGGFSSLKYCHDWDFAFRTISYAEPVYIPETLYFYRQHSTNSYKALQDHAHEETELVLRRYFRSVKLGRVTNPLAPSPLTWPGVFEVFAKRYGVYRWWMIESGAYTKASRVTDDSTAILRVEG